MFDFFVSFVVLSLVFGSSYPHSLPVHHENPPEWDRPIVVSEEVFPPHPPQNEFKEIIGIELQRIPVHGDLEREQEILEHERRKQHEILEHERLRKHEILKQERRELEHREHEFLEQQLPHEILEQKHREHEVFSHEYPHEYPYEGLEHKHHDPHGFPHDVLKHEHEVMSHNLPHDILEHEHEILAHEHYHEMHHPPWEAPDFFIDDEPHFYHEPEFEHRELFPEGARKNGNRRRENEGNSRRINSIPSRRENSNREGSSRRNREGGSGINTEELFPRKNTQNNNQRNNSNNNRRNGNNNNNSNREGSRRNSNLQEMAALDEEIIEILPEVTGKEKSRPERQAGSYDGLESSVYETSRPQPLGDSGFQTHELNSSTDRVNRQSNFDSQRSQYGDNILNDSKSYRPDSGSFGNSKTPSSSNNQENLSNSNLGFQSVGSTQNSNQQSSSGSTQERLSGNIFLQEDYLVLDGPNSQRPNSRPGSTFGQEQSWGSALTGQSSGFGLNRPGSYNEESLRPKRPSNVNDEHGYLGSRPGSGKPAGPTSQENSRPNRPSTEGSGLFSSYEEKPNRPGNSGLYSNQEKNRPGNSGHLPTNHEESPKRPDNSDYYTNEENRPHRPGNSGHHTHYEERPNHPVSSGHYTNQEERPHRPGNSGHHVHYEEKPNHPVSSGHYTNQEERPNRPNSGSSGDSSHYEERPNRPGSSGHYTSQEEKPNRPSNSHNHGHNAQGSRPNKPNDGYSHRPSEEDSRPRPPNGNNPKIPEVISAQRDSWLWPNPSEDEEKQNRRFSHPGGHKKPSGTTARPGNNKKKQHANIKLLPMDLCGVDLGNKIIGGTNTQLDEFPWMALLQHSSGGSALGFGCGGSLISPRYVLTAAHCIKGPAIGKNVRVTKVRLGEFDTSSDTDCQGELCSPPPVDVSVEEVIVHPKYRSTDRAQMHDIALIRLRENVKTSAYVSPICLPLNAQSKDHVGEKLTVAGWGKTSNGQSGKSSKTKQKVSLPVVSLNDCSPFYNRINIKLNTTQMCAGGEKGKDSCQGDSGGPLMGSEIVDSQVRWQVHGIVSFGPEDCGIDDVAGVYTRVSDYIDWILDNMKK